MRIALAICLSLLAFVVRGAEETPLKVFFGNLHSHTSYSDGSGTPEEAYRHARFTAGLDFLAITEHNHAQADGDGDRKDGIVIATRPDLYKGPREDALIPVALRMTEKDKFVALYGQEFSSISKGNHVNVFDIDEIIPAPNGKFDVLMNWLKTRKDSTGQPAIIQFNHPNLYDDLASEYGADDFPTDDKWIKTMDAQTELLELINGPAMARTGGHRAAEVAEDAYLYYLRLGFQLGPTADQDNHYFTWGSSTDARTAVIAKELTKAGILEGLRQRHVYASEDKNLRVITRVNGALCGDQLDAPALNSALKVEVSIADDDEPAAEYTVEIFAGKVGTQAVVVGSIDVSGNTPANAPLVFDDVKYTGGHQYVFVKMSQHREHGRDDRVWTAPVWFKPGPTPTLMPETVAEARVEAWASRRQNIYHISQQCCGFQQVNETNRVIGLDARLGRMLHPKCPIIEPEPKP